MVRSALLSRVAVACLVASLPATIAIAQPVPVATADPLATLAPEKRAFLSDPATIARFGLTREKLAIAIAGRSPAEIDAYATALMAVVEDAKFKPGRDTAEIALNPKASGFNAGTTLRPAFLDARQRDPGPFSLDRYMFQKGGIPTFAHAPIAIRTEDLVAGKIEVAFVGVPLDLSSGWRDAKHAPSTLRAMDGLVGADGDGAIDPNLALRIADFGDISVDNMAPERSVDHVRMMVASIAKTGAVPFIVGGDHLLMFPDMAAMADVYGAQNVRLLQFDAHAEAERDGDHFITDNQSLTRLIEQKLVLPGNVTQVGLRGRGVDAATVSRLRGMGVVVHPMASITERGADTIMADILAAGEKGPANLFFSFDMSVLDPGIASAAGRPVPGGMTMREAIPMVRKICASARIVGFELLDTAPILDPTYVSALSANYILHACLSGIAMRKAETVKTAGK